LLIGRIAMIDRPPTPPGAPPAAAARDHLGDICELLGFSARTTVVGDRVQLPPLRAADARALADSALTGVMHRRLTLTPGAPLWSMRLRGVGIVTDTSRDEVTLRSLATGERWRTGASDLRAATLEEINTAQGVTSGAERM
jgi:hypothetical protein